MQTKSNIATRFNYISLPIAPARAASASAKKGVGSFMVDFLFAAFCVGAIAGIWYFFHAFQNDSYKAVASFLDLITVSNVSSRYLLARI